MRHNVQLTHSWAPSVVDKQEKRARTVVPSNPMKSWGTLTLALCSTALVCGAAFAAPDNLRPSDAITATTTATPNILVAPPTPKSSQSQQDVLQNFITTKAGQLKTAGQVATKTANTVVDRTSDIVLSAMGFIGVPYRRGGTSFETGFDCSGFVHALFEQTVGLALPRVAKEQAQATQVIAKSDLKPGDLVFFNTMRRAFSHVGIYIGDNKFIHSPRSGAEIRIEDMSVSYWQRRFNGARRVDLPPELTAAASAANSNAAISGTALNNPAVNPAVLVPTVVSKDANAMASPTLSTMPASSGVAPATAESAKSASPVTNNPSSPGTTTPKTPSLQLKSTKDLSNSSL